MLHNAKAGDIMQVTVAQAREELAEILNKVAYTKERVTITRRGKRIAVIIPTEVAELLEDLERRIDQALLDAAEETAAARGSTVEESSISLDEAKKQLKPRKAVVMNNV
jgi:prevent-host-death family protein